MLSAVQVENLRRIAAMASFSLFSLFLRYQIRALLFFLLLLLILSDDAKNHLIWNASPGSKRRTLRNRNSWHFGVSSGMFSMQIPFPPHVYLYFPFTYSRHNNNNGPSFSHHQCIIMQKPLAFGLFALTIALLLFSSVCVLCVHLVHSYAHIGNTKVPTMAPIFDIKTMFL